MAARNMARPAMPAVQLFQRLRGRITREAPAMASSTRKANQLRRSRRTFTSLGTSSTRAKRAPRPRLRSRAAVVSCRGATEVEVVLITLRSGTVQCFSTCAGKRQKQFVSNAGAVVVMSGILEAVDLAHAGEGTADVRNGDGAADDEGDVEGVDDLVTLPAFFAAAHE